MHGNVWQWVEDCYLDYGPAMRARVQIGAELQKGFRSYPSREEQAGCSKRVVRGGSWADESGSLRSASRLGLSADFQRNVVGFRVGRSLVGPD